MEELRAAYITHREHHAEQHHHVRTTSAVLTRVSLTRMRRGLIRF